MGDIRTVVDRTQNLTINVAEGPLAIDEVLGAIEQYLAHDPTLKVLWDFRGADGAGIDSQDDSVWIFVGSVIDQVRIFQQNTP